MGTCLRDVKRLWLELSAYGWTLFMGIMVPASLTYAQAPTRLGRQVVEVEGVDGTPFGQIVGLALDRIGNQVVVVDRMASQVHVISAEGLVQASFGRPGKGPGDFERPCCPRVSPDGRIWILNPALRRVDGFRVTNGVVQPDTFRIIQGPFSFLRAGPPVIRHDGGMLVTVIRRAMATGAERWAVLEIDPRGEVTGEYPLPSVPADFPGAINVRFPDDRIIQRPVPFGPEYWLVQSHGGSYARVITSAYDIVHYELDGSVRYRIEKDISGTALTQMERENAEQELERLRREAPRWGGTVPDVRLPDAKPVIAGIWFDEEGRLWVKRYDSTPEGLARADVYATSGSLLFHAHWPGDVKLSDGAIAGNMAWGVRHGTFGEHSLVRLEFR